MPPITSLQNPRVKEAVKLRDHRDRQRSGRFVIDGVREVWRAVEAGVEVLEVFACPQHLDEPTLRWVEVLAAGTARVFQVTPAILAKLAYGDRSEGLVAVARTPERSLEALRLPGRPLVVVLETPEKPGNVGAVLRTADAAGASAVVVADPATDLYNPNAIRASLGAIFTVPVCAAESTAVLRWLRDQRLAIYTARVDGLVTYTDVSYAEPCAIVLGSEAHGLTDLWRGEDITSIALPMRGRVDSLNVSTTAAVLLYEALRQRGTDLSPNLSR
jgi:TrmH family RNA methyltransferase